MYKLLFVTTFEMILFFSHDSDLTGSEAFTKKNCDFYKPHGGFTTLPLKFGIFRQILEHFFEFFSLHSWMNQTFSNVQCFPLSFRSQPQKAILK